MTRQCSVSSELSLSPYLPTCGTKFEQHLGARSIAPALCPALYRDNTFRDATMNSRRNAVLDRMYNDGWTSGPVERSPVQIHEETATNGPGDASQQGYSEGWKMWQRVVDAASEGVRNATTAVNRKVNGDDGLYGKVWRARTLFPWPQLNDDRRNQNQTKRIMQEAIAT